MNYKEFYDMKMDACNLVIYNWFMTDGSYIKGGGGDLFYIQSVFHKKEKKKTKIKKMEKSFQQYKTF